jgi:hypothetical protein
MDLIQELMCAECLEEGAVVEELQWNVQRFGPMPVVIACVVGMTFIVLGGKVEGR